jgi:hypothetical protein
MDEHDGEEIVNLAEDRGGLGDKASVPNSPTAAEECTKRGALVAMFKRMLALPKIRVHCLKQRNPLAWCLQWPTLTLNPSPPVFFEDPAGAGRCVKLTIVTPLTTQRTMKGREAPPFTASCKRANYACIVGPVNALRARADLDPARSACPQPFEQWDDHGEALYNDRSFCPEAQARLFIGVGRGDVNGVDPSKLYHERTGDMLKSKFSELQSAYTRSLANFQLSGQKAADSFPRFANGDIAVMYLHCLAQTGEGSRLCDFSSRLMPEDAQQKEGISSAPGEAVYGKIAADSRRAASRIRKRQSSPSRATEVTVRGLEELVPMDPYAT